MIFRLFRYVLLSLTLAALPLSALEAPKNTPLLTVTGAISDSNTNGAALFDRAMLEALDWREITTFTSFTTGPQQFAGPTLASLLDALGVVDGMLRATAVNDYTIEIPVKHAKEHDVLLAMDHNGKPMRIREKGPIWIIYPLSEERAALKPFDGEMIWQLVRLEVIE